MAESPALQDRKCVKKNGEYLERFFSIYCSEGMRPDKKFAFFKKFFVYFLSLPTILSSIFFLGELND
jgi:hypothetical protein